MHFFLLHIGWYVITPLLTMIAGGTLLIWNSWLENFNSLRGRILVLVCVEGIVYSIFLGVSASLWRLVIQHERHLPFLLWLFCLCTSKDFRVASLIFETNWDVFVNIDGLFFNSFISVLFSREPCSLLLDLNVLLSSSHLFWAYNTSTIFVVIMILVHRQKYLRDFRLEYSIATKVGRRMLIDRFLHIGVYIYDGVKLFCERLLLSRLIEMQNLT